VCQKGNKRFEALIFQKKHLHKNKCFGFRVIDYAILIHYPLSKGGKTMKKLIGMILIIGLFVFIGCGNKKSNSTGPGVIHNGRIHTNVSGNYNLTFNCTTAYCVATQGTNRSMDIQGFVTSGADTFSITINISDAPTSGTWTLGFPAENWGVIEKNNTMNYSESGSVTVTGASSSKVVGTFNFEAFGMGGTTVTVSDGTFNAPIISAN
jgi:hypothetical protein